MFLLYGGTQIDAKLALQKLYVAAMNPLIKTQYLHEWAIHSKDEWKNILIEALSIVKCNKCLRKIGLNIDDLQDQYLPQHPDVNLNVHPILKGLYYVCDQLIPEEVIYVTRKIQIIHNRAEEINTQFLEITLLHWLADRLIEAGEWSRNLNNTTRTIHCELQPIFGQYFCFRILLFVLNHVS